MNIINIIRDNFGLTQVEIADYLEVSRYYVNLMEHGKRDITTALNIKLFELYDIFMKNNYVAPALKSSNRKRSKEDIAYKIALLERRLKRMQETYSNLCSQLQKIEILRKLPHDRGKELLYDISESEIKDKLEHYSLEKQNKLITEIERLKKLLLRE